LKIEYWFPTVTASHAVDAELQQLIQQRIQAWIESGAHSTYLQACAEDNLRTSYFRHHDTLGDLNLPELREHILECAVAYVGSLGLNIQADQLRVDSWINFFEPGQSEQQHNHYGNFISGTYYVQGAPHSGCYRFFDPAAQKTMWRGIYLQGAQPAVSNLSSGEYQPQPGTMILFPSWLEHAVMCNHSGQTRISIAFNINPKNGIRV
jgi:uncharacterized protein (TIGR02466 family)